MTYRLKDGVNFKMVSKKALMKYDFYLDDYYDENTRIFTFPQGYVAWHLMAEVFKEFLTPLNLVEEVNDERN